MKCFLTPEEKINVVSPCSHVISSIKNYYISTNEIPGELSCKNLISSHLKISLLLWLNNKSHLSHQETIKVIWFGISLVFI